MALMHPRRLSLAITTAILLLSAACSSPAAAPATSAPQSPAATAKPASTTALAPTSAPAAKKVDFPAKGKSISIIVPFPAGGGSDIEVRILQPFLEKELGVPIEIENKGGAGSMVGITAAAQAKPDGYTIGNANWPTIISLYTDPNMKAAFNRKSFEAVALHTSTPEAFAVKADSPFKTIKDLVDAAKAKPHTISIGNDGLLSSDHLGSLQLEKESGAQFNIVSFDGAAPGNTALLGGHINVFTSGISSMLPLVKSGQLRFLAFYGNDGKQVMPNVPTMADEGYSGFEAFGLYRGFFVPAGTPKEIVDVLDGAMKRAMMDSDQQAKTAAAGQITMYKDVADFSAFWDNMETTIKPVIEEALKATK